MLWGWNVCDVVLLIARDCYRVFYVYQDTMCSMGVWYRLPYGSPDVRFTYKCVF